MQQERKDALKALIAQITAAQTELQNGLLEEVEELFNESDGSEPDYDEIDQAFTDLDAANDQLIDALTNLNDALGDDDVEVVVLDDEDDDPSDPEEDDACNGCTLCDDPEYADDCPDTV